MAMLGFTCDFLEIQDFHGSATEGPQLFRFFTPKNSLCDNVL